MDVDGRYAVYVRWSAASNRNATADYTVHHADGTTTITHNQQTDGGVWKPLGTYDLESAATHKVVLADTGLGVTIADAVLLVPMEMESRLVSADTVKLVANDAEDVLTVHADHRGAPQKMTDDTRTVVWDAAFTPFGEEDSTIGAETNNWRFPGQYTDDESGLSYNWHRHYDPAIGRYLQSDPIGLGGGLNTYAYVGSNPVGYVDPTGEVAFVIPFIFPFLGGSAVEGAVVGLGIGVGGLIADLLDLNDGPTTNEMAKDGKQNIENEYSRAAKQLAHSNDNNENDPCVFLAAWLKEAKRQKDNVAIQKIRRRRKI